MHEPSRTIPVPSFRGIQRRASQPRGWPIQRHNFDLSVSSRKHNNVPDPTQSEFGGGGGEFKTAAENTNDKNRWTVSTRLACATQRHNP
jgi:hypothetical protein